MRATTDRTLSPGFISRPRPYPALAGVCLVVALPLSSGASADTVASDMTPTGSSALLDVDNPFDMAFENAGDGFQKYQRGVSSSIPFSITDDSLGVFVADTLGIVDENDGVEFFGVTDLVNPDNAAEAAASWRFDIAGRSGLALSIDMAAMGDFESNDRFAWTYRIDGGTEMTAFEGVVAEDESQGYTLAGGYSTTLDDPFTVGGRKLGNRFGTFRTFLVGEGDVLTLTLTALADGGSEALAFRNIVIEDGTAPPPPPTPPTVSIAEIQGSGAESPFEAQEVVTVGNVVTAVLGNGFYLQSPDAFQDADVETSEGIFVFTGSPPAVAPGDVVDVAGEVVEFFGLTEITNVTTLDNRGGGALVTPTALLLPIGTFDIESFWERREGMLVSFPQTLYVSGNFSLGRFGELDLALDAPLDTPTNVVAPGFFAAMLQDENERRVIQLDDGSSVQNPEPPPYFGADGTRRAGDSVRGLLGVLGFGFGSYELIPTETPDFIRANARPSTTPDVGGPLVVASYNVLNYFTTLDGSGSICGPAADAGCRGADNATELERQQAKLVAALVGLDADIVGVIELENSPDDTPLATLVEALNTALGSDSYAYLATGAIGTDAIRVGLVYRAASVVPAGDFALLDTDVDPRFDDTRNRPALAQSFQEIGGERTLTVVVNHLKSKGSDCEDIGDPDTGDGQGNCNGTRTAAAGALVDWLETDPTGTGEAEPAVLVLGDLNAYAQEDPVTALEAAGYTDLIARHVGTGRVAGAYSYVFFGQSGYLDHALANTAMLARVTGAAFWHINADEPAALDYNDFNQSSLFSPDPFRSSDHDPVVVGVCDSVPPSGQVSLSPDKLWPPNGRYAKVSATLDVVDVDATVSLLSVESNEPDNGHGDGDTIDDVVIVDDTTFRLRQERAGGGSGRVYTITYRLTDACGNTSLLADEVRVAR